VRLVHINDSTTKNGVNQETRFPKKKRSTPKKWRSTPKKWRSTPKQTGQTLLENWQRKSDARSCYDCLLPGYIAADCTIYNGQAAALRVILEWLASTHEAVLPKHNARSAVRAWFRTNGVDFGRHDTNVLSLVTAAVNKAGLAVPKAGRPAVKRAVGIKTNPVNAVSSNDDSISESSSSSSCYIDFSFTRVAEEATIVYVGLKKTSGDTHRCLHSMLDLGNPHVLAGAEWWTEEYKPLLLACGWDPIKEVTSLTTSGFGDGPQSTLLCVAKAVPFRLHHHDGSTTLYFSDVAIAQIEVGLLAGKCDVAALLTDIQMSPTLTTCRVLHNTSPILLVDPGGHLFARQAESAMAGPGENFVFLHKKKNGAVFAKVKTAPENSSASITNLRMDVSVTNGGSPWDTAARLNVRPTDSKQFDKTSNQTMHVKLVRSSDAEKVMGGLHHFSEHLSDDEFVPDKQPNDDPPVLFKNLIESVKSSYSISLADLPKMHRTLDHPSRLRFSHILRQELNVDTLPEDLQNAADLVHDHCVICVKYSRPVPCPRVALPSVHQPGVCASVDYGDIHHPSRGKAFRLLIMADDFSGRIYALIVDNAFVTGKRTAEAFMMLSCETFAKVAIDLVTRFDNKFFRTLLGRMGTEVLTVPTDAHWASHAEGGWEPKFVLSRRTLTGPCTRRSL
jgi:hypothetical protein